MTENVLTLRDNPTIGEIGDLLKNTDVNGFPLTQEGRVVGLISRQILFVLLMNPSRFDNNQARQGSPLSWEAFTEDFEGQPISYNQVEHIVINH